MSRELNALHRAITEHVFVTSEDHVIVSANGNASNWLFDFRRILLKAEHLNGLAELFWERYEQHYPFQVGGLESASIPLIAAIVMKGVEKGRPINGFFIRKSRKKHGLLNMIEGEIVDAPIILVDDIINSGKSIARQVAVIDQLQKRIIGVFVILRFRAVEYYDFLINRNIAIESLFSLPDFGKSLLKSDGIAPARQDAFDVQWYFKGEKPNYYYVVPKSAPALDAERVYFGTDSGYFFALHQRDGSVAWRRKVGFSSKGKSIFSSPVVRGGIVYFGAYDGNVYALDAATGKRKWVFFDADWVGSSPALAPRINLLFIGLEFGLFKKHGGIVALDMQTGKKAWEYSMPEYTHGSPAYSEKHAVVAIGSNDGVAYLFDAKTGSLIWNYRTDGEIKGTPAFDEQRGYVVFGSHDGGTYIFDIVSGSLRYMHKAAFAIYSNPLVVGDNLYVASLDKRLYCIDLDRFVERWVFVANGRIFASPVFADGSIFVGANDSRLYELDAHTGKEIAFFQITERITNAIAHNAETGSFFLPSFANELYCLRRKQK